MSGVLVTARFGRSSFRQGRRPIMVGSWVAVVLLSVVAMGPIRGLAAPASTGGAPSGAPSGAADRGAAATGSSAAKFSVAMVDMQAAILQTEEGKSAKVKIEKEAQSKRDALIKQQEDLNTLGQEFQSQQGVLSDESKLERQKEIQSKMQALRTAQISFEQEVRRKEMEETQKIIESLQKIIDEMARKKGYDFVFERNSGALLYAPSVDDITAEVVKAYNSRSPAKSTKSGKAAKAETK